jgi:hypothetical protein
VSRKPKLPTHVPAEATGTYSLVKPKKKVNKVVDPTGDFLVRRRDDSDRDQTVLHPSEMAKPTWCWVRDYYRISKTEPSDPEPKPHGVYTLRAFEEGHSIHRKWQGWWWEMGILEGRWKCLICTNQWWDTSPSTCPQCDSELIEYREVPFVSNDHLIGGYADGLLDLSLLDELDGAITDDEPVEKELVEIKSIGPGTIRIEHPDYYKRYVGAGGDLSHEDLWKELRRPFPSHIRQGMIYAWARGMSRMVYIYEWKTTQAVKEFEVVVSMRILGPLLRHAEEVVIALDEGRPPERPQWTVELDKKTKRPLRENHPECKSCRWRTRCWDLEAKAENEERRNRRDGFQEKRAVVRRRLRTA